MTYYYVDPSALAKRYLREDGSRQVRSLTSDDNNNVIFVAEISLAEISAVIAANRRAPGGISEGMRRRILARFLSDCHQRFDIITTSRPIIDKAVELCQRYRLRGYDAVQLSAAVSVQKTLDAHSSRIDLTFVASDIDLLNAARIELRQTVEPRNLP